MRSEKTSLGMFLTPDENRRLLRAFLHIWLSRQHRTMPVRWQSDEYLALNPFQRALDCASSMGYEIFARQLIDATLWIYHNAGEWLVIFYATALLLPDDVIYEMVNDLTKLPPDLAAFNLRVLSQVEAEMSEQIAANFTHTPYTCVDPKSTREHFTYLYGEALPRLATLKKRLAAHNLHF